jgi:hypothetical protein
VYGPVTNDCHMFVTEIGGNCGMGTWSRMSAAAHVVAKAVEGPYNRIGESIPAQCHNAYYAFCTHTKKHLLYHIGTGNNPASCNPIFNCTSGRTYGCKGLTPPPTHAWPNATCPCTQQPYVSVTLLVAFALILLLAIMPVEKCAFK